MVAACWDRNATQRLLSVYVNVNVYAALACRCRWSRKGFGPKSRWPPLAQTGISPNLFQNLPARTARKKFREICLYTAGLILEIKICNKSASRSHHVACWPFKMCWRAQRAKILTKFTAVRYGAHSARKFCRNMRHDRQQPAPHRQRPKAGRSVADQGRIEGQPRTDMGRYFGGWWRLAGGRLGCILVSMSLTLTMSWA